MLNEFSRTELLIGEKALKRLQKSKVAIFGIGGVTAQTDSLQNGRLEPSYIWNWRSRIICCRRIS